MSWPKDARVATYKHAEAGFGRLILPHRANKNHVPTHAEERNFFWMSGVTSWDIEMTSRATHKHAEVGPGRLFLANRARKAHVPPPCRGAEEGVDQRGDLLEHHDMRAVAQDDVTNARHASLDLARTTCASRSTFLQCTESSRWAPMPTQVGLLSNQVSAAITVWIVKVPLMTGASPVQFLL